MHNFTFNGQSLATFGGRILQAPFHTIAKRNISFMKIYGQSGDEIIDNESYDNVDFSLKICFMPLLTAYTAKQLAYAVIDWLAPLQNDYYTYTDTYNPGYFTKAVLTNFGDIKRDLPTLLTATLKFKRVPFWYSNDGVEAVTLYNGGKDNILTNPEAHSSEPIYRFVYLRQGDETLSIIVNGITNSVLLPNGDVTYYFDNVQKQFYRISNNTKIYLGSVLLPNFSPGNNLIKFRVTGQTSGSFRFEITPNWRRL